MTGNSDGVVRVSSNNNTKLYIYTLFPEKKLCSRVFTDYTS